MLNYYDSKFLHLAFVIIFITAQAAQFYNTNKLSKIFAGIASLFTLLTGFLLLKRFGISHSGPYPVWVIMKLVIWGLLAIIFPVIFKRLRTFLKILYLPWLILIIMAAAMAIYKF